MSLDRAAILAADDRVSVEVDVPEWGGTIYLRGLSVGRRDRLIESLKDAKLDDIRIALFIESICDEYGKPIFKQSDAKKLKDKSASVIDRLTEHLERMNADTEDEREK